MQFVFPSKKKFKILALGAESAGNFSIFQNGKIFLSKDFGDLLDEKNFQKFKKSILSCLKKNKIKPNILLTDLHPFYKTTIWAQELSKKFKTKHIQVQHHLAHIFSCLGENILTSNLKLQNRFSGSDSHCCPRKVCGMFHKNTQIYYADKCGSTNFVIHKSKILNLKPFIGLACDGTGYGLDGKIWGGEVFGFEIRNSKFEIRRVGHLENQVMIGGDLAIQEPARMLISILAKIPSSKLPMPNKKNFVYAFIKKYYTYNQFEILYNQLQQNFNCQETSSTGRILDAVSVLLGFTKNQRNYKHEPIDLLEDNSTIPYHDLKPQISCRLSAISYQLLTTPLFKYLAQNLHRDKKRLAATAQLYIAQGLYKIAKKLQTKKPPVIYFAGGLANNKIISSYLESKGVITNKKIPTGDAAISFGQIIYYTMNGM